MARLPDSSFRGIVTSPPYNLRNSSGSGLRDGRGGEWRRAALLKGYATHGDAMPHDRYLTWQRLPYRYEAAFAAGRDDFLQPQLAGPGGPVAGQAGYRGRLSGAPDHYLAQV